MAKQFKYNTANAEYTYYNGQPVTTRTLNSWAKIAIENAQISLSKDTHRMVDRKLSIDAWSNKMRDHIRAGHRMMAKLAYGPTLSAKQAGRLGAIVKAQYKYLDNFTRGLKDKSINRTDAAVSRANLYLKAMYATFQNELKRAKQDAGYTHALNILDDDSESCVECPTLTALGWMPIENMPFIGMRICNIGCNCEIEYARGT